MSFTKDYSRGFGGRYGVQKDHMDKSAVGWDYQEKVDKHESQTGNSWCVQNDARITSLCLYIIMLVAE